MGKGKIYNISNKLTGFKPVVMIDEDHEFEIKTSLPIVIQVQAMMKDDKLDYIDAIGRVIKMTLGEKAYEYIESKELPFDQLVLIFQAISAAISGEDLEDMIEERKQKGKKRG